MRQVLLVTNDKVRCGLHDYARACFDVLKKSKKYEYKFLPIKQNESDSYYIDYFNSRPEDIIVFNHCPWTMPWLSTSVLAGIKKTRCMITGHDHVHDPIDEIAQYFNVDPTFEPKAEHSHSRQKAIPRPVPIYDDIVYHQPDTNKPLSSGEPLIVGTFGFGQVAKQMDKIVQLINDQCTDIDVEFRMHISPGDYIHDFQSIEIIDTCRNTANENVKIWNSVDFISDRKKLIRWLNRNDINIFAYQDMTWRNAVSSSLDLALSARKPIGLIHGNLFRHVYDIPDIFLFDTERWDPVLGKRMPRFDTPEELQLVLAQHSKNTILGIYKQGLAPLEPLYKKWSEQNFIDSFESEFDTL